jgi:hypothetical protein
MVERYDAEEAGKLRALFVSREELDISNALLIAPAIVIGPEDNGNDIKSFVRTATRKFIRYKELFLWT